MKLKTIIVDDEESARDVLENLLHRFCPNVELIAKCSNLPVAVELIKSHQPHLVFMDIEMPMYAGFEIVNFIEDINFKIIFVTAYDKYAVRAFEIAALDYLLKPVDISRLKKAVERATKETIISQQNKSLPLLNNSLSGKPLNNIVISDRGQQYIIPLTDIIAIEAQEAYCNIYTQQRNIMVSKNLKHFENLLESLPYFFRTHKSWLINITCVKHYSKSELTVTLTNSIVTKLSKYKKNEFEVLLT